MDTLDVAALSGQVMICTRCNAEHMMRPLLLAMSEDDDGNLEPLRVSKVSLHCGCGHEIILPATGEGG